MRAVVYTRLSRRTDTNEVNLADQAKRCREFADRQGWEVVEVVDDYGESAFERDAIEDRPGFARVLELVAEGVVDVILAWRPDRLWRDPTEAAYVLRACRKAGVQAVATVTEGVRDPANPSDEMTATITAVVARYESAAKSARLRAKARQLAEAGRPPGGAAPFGYDTRRRIVPAEAELIREAFGHILAGGSIRSLAAAWGERGVRTKNGAEWTQPNLSRMLRQPHVAALRQHRDRIIGPATWDPIVSVEDWYAVQAALAESARTRSQRRTYLLTGGLAVCGRCGTAMVAQPVTGGARSIRCPRSPGAMGCGFVRRRADPVEAEVLARLWARLRAGDIPPDVVPRPVDSVSLADLEAVEAKLVQLGHDHYVADLISRPVFLAAHAPLAAEAERLRAALDRRPRGPRLPPPSEWEAGWGGYEFGMQREILRSAILTVTIHPAVRGNNRFDPTKVEIDWR